MPSELKATEEPELSEDAAPLISEPFCVYVLAAAVVAAVVVPATAVVVVSAASTPTHITNIASKGAEDAVQCILLDDNELCHAGIAA